MKEFDYIVIGGGSGGCAVAGRLSEDPKVSVCLLEAGASDDRMLIKVPFCTVMMLPTRINNWAFETVPQPGLNGRYCPTSRNRNTTRISTTSITARVGR